MSKYRKYIKRPVGGVTGVHGEHVQVHVMEEHKKEQEPVTTQSPMRQALSHVLLHQSPTMIHNHVILECVVSIRYTPDKQIQEYYYGFHQ